MFRDSRPQNCPEKLSKKHVVWHQSCEVCYVHAVLVPAPQWNPDTFCSSWRNCAPFQPPFPTQILHSHGCLTTDIAYKWEAVLQGLQHSFRVHPQCRLHQYVLLLVASNSPSFDEPFGLCAIHRWTRGLFLTGAGSDENGETHACIFYPCCPWVSSEVCGRARAPGPHGNSWKCQTSLGAVLEKTLVA